MKTIKVHGKEYAPVNERVKAFRTIEEYTGWSIETDIVEITDNRIVTKTFIKNVDSKIISTGLAFEMEGNSNINKTSHIENCETSSIGRALGFLGIGIDGAIATAEEVINAIQNQDNKTDKKDATNQGSKEKQTTKEQTDDLDLQIAITAINGSKTLDDLKKNYESYVKFARVDAFSKAKENKKIELTPKS